MTSGQERLHSVLTDEHDVFVTDCRQLYLDVAAKLKHPPKIDTSLIFVGKNPAKKYVNVCMASLQDNHMIMVVSKGSELAKLVAVAEQVKQSTKGKVSQMNKLFRQPSLVNPGFSSQNSISNVQMFFGDETTEGTPAQAALKEIKGHKVYDVACMAIVLADGKMQILPADFNDWTIQVKGQ